MSWVQSLLTTDLCLVRSAVRLRAYERAGDLRSAAGGVTEECEECGDPVGEYGCRHDGHAFCNSCLDYCDECRDAMRGDFYPDRTYR